MDNETSTALNTKMTSMNIKYQLGPPSKHRAKNVERAMQNFKKYFIAVMWSVEIDFHLQIWDILLQQAKISLNFLTQSRTIPHLSAYTYISGEFDYNRTPLAPPGKRLVIHNRPNERASWEPHGEESWYIGPEMEHCRCHNTYIPKTRAERISDTVDFPPK